jgi:hypothetical protein
VRVIVTRIEWDGTMQRRLLDTAQRSDARQWEQLVTRARAILPRYTPAPHVPLYHVRVDSEVVHQAAEHDLAGALLDLVTAVLALGEDVLAARPAFTGREGGPARSPRLMAGPGPGRAGRGS